MVSGAGTTAQTAGGGASAGEAVSSHRRRQAAGAVGAGARTRTDTRQRRAERAARVAWEDGCLITIGQPCIVAHPACMGMERQQLISVPYTCFSERPAAGTSARAHAGD